MVDQVELRKRQLLWRCEGCYDVFAENELLRAPNPFDVSDEIVACPHCKHVEQFTNICDWPGCFKIVSSGTPMPNGDYVNRCLDHGPHHLAKRGLPAYPPHPNNTGEV